MDKLFRAIMNKSKNEKAQAAFMSIGCLQIYLFVDLYYDLVQELREYQYKSEEDKETRESIIKLKKRMKEREVLYT